MLSTFINPRSFPLPNDISGFVEVIASEMHRRKTLSGLSFMVVDAVSVLR